jgi:hypothetical protein
MILPAIFGFIAGFASCWVFVSIVGGLIARGMRNRGVRWECRRCGKPVDLSNGRCGCDSGPSPWERKP